MRSVNLTLCFALVSCALSCGPAPRPIPPLPQASAEPARLPSAPRLAWRKDVGSGILAPLEARGVALFVSTTNRAVVALALDTGRRFWIQRFNGAITTGITIAHGRLYFASADLRGSAYALDAARGRRVWSQRIGPSRTQPVVVEERVVLGTDDGWVYALNSADGSIAWRTRLPGGVLIAPVRWKSSLLVATTADSVYTLDAGTGTIQARTRLLAAPSAPPLLRGDTLVLPLQDGSVTSLQAPTLEHVRTFRLADPVLAAPVEVNGVLYLLNRAGDLWRVGSGPPGLAVSMRSAARGALSAVDGRLLVGLLDGRLLAVDTTGEVEWEYQAARSLTVPVTAVGAALFVPLLHGDVLKLQ